MIKVFIDIDDINTLFKNSSHYITEDEIEIFKEFIVTFYNYDGSGAGEEIVEKAEYKKVYKYKEYQKPMKEFTYEKGIEYIIDMEDMEIRTWDRETYKTICRCWDCSSKEEFKRKDTAMNKIFDLINDPKCIKQEFCALYAISDDIWCTGVTMYLRYKPEENK